MDQYQQNNKTNEKREKWWKNEGNEYKETLGKNWELTTGVVQWRKQPKLDCIDTLSRIIISEERERDENFQSLPPNPENQRGFPEEKPQQKKKKKKKQSTEKE